MPVPPLPDEAITSAPLSVAYWMASSSAWLVEAPDRLKFIATTPASVAAMIASAMAVVGQPGGPHTR